jgi:hypothetical protein
LQQSFAGVPKFVSIETGNGPFDAVESPAGETVAICGEHQEQIESEIGSLESLKPPVCSKSMVEPSKGLGHTPATLRDKHREFFLQGHDVSLQKRSRRTGVRWTPLNRYTATTHAPTRPAGQVRLTKRHHFPEKSFPANRRAWKKKIQNREVEDN